MEPQPVQDQIASLEKALKLFSILQYAGPILLTVMAFVFMAAFVDEGEVRLRIILSACFIIAAILEFLVLRFVLLPQFKRQLRVLKGDSAASLSQ